MTSRDIQAAESGGWYGVGEVMVDGRDFCCSRELKAQVATLYRQRQTRSTDRGRAEDGRVQQGSTGNVVKFSREDYGGLLGLSEKI